MVSMRSTVRRCVLGVLQCCGIIHLWRFFNRSRIVILMIHGVMDSEAPEVWQPLRPRLASDRLKRFLSVLSRHYQFVSLQCAVDMLDRKIPIKPYCIVVTFDDGYRNNATKALPILRQYGVPATFFLATGHMTHRKPYWCDRLDYILQHVPVHGREIKVASRTVRLLAADRVALGSSYDELRRAAKSAHRPDAEMVREMEGLAHALEAETGRGLTEIFEADDWTALLTWAEVEQLAADGVSFGSHTVSHVRLGLVDEKTAISQLADSKSAIEQHVRGPCRHFAYPNGSFNRRTPELVKKCGYSSAVTTIEGTNQVGDDPLRLRRFNVPTEGGTTELLARVCGLSESLTKLENCLKRLFRIQGGCMPRVHQDDDSDRSLSVSGG